MATPRKTKPCEFKDCKNILGPGSAEIGFIIEGDLFKIKACPFHSAIVGNDPPGTWEITKDRELKKQLTQFFIKRPTRVNL